MSLYASAYIESELVITRLPRPTEHVDEIESVEGWMIVCDSWICWSKITIMLTVDVLFTSTGLADGADNQRIC